MGKIKVNAYDKEGVIQKLCAGTQEIFVIMNSCSIKGAVVAYSNKEVASIWVSTEQIK